MKPCHNIKMQLCCVLSCRFSTKSAKTVAREIGGQVAFADPVAADWMENLRVIADKFKSALK